MKEIKSDPVAYRIQIRNGGIHFIPLSPQREAFSVPADTIFTLSVTHHRDEIHSYSEAWLDGVHAAHNGGAMRPRENRVWTELHFHAGELRDLRLTIYPA